MFNVQGVRGAIMRKMFLFCLAMMGWIQAAVAQNAPQAPGRDLRLTYCSKIDGAEQPYRMYVPSSYDGSSPYPLVVALHGTTGDENTFFESPLYVKRPATLAAEKYGMLLVCPYGRGPMEYRGIAENDVFSVMEEVQKNYKIDPDRIYITGHSMGGTASAYLALHYPDLFAASAPLGCGSDYVWHRLAANGRHIPIWFVSGEKDQQSFLLAVKRGVEQMRAFGDPVQYTEIKGEAHYGPVMDMESILAWLSSHRLARHPSEFTFVVDTPFHGQAYWIRVTRLSEPGHVGIVKAGIEGSQIRVDPIRIAGFAVLPDSGLMRPGQELTVIVEGKQVFRGKLDQHQELRIERKGHAWISRLAALQQRVLTDFRTYPVARAERQLDMRGTETSLGNLVTDSMRWATGADVALYNRQYYRGLPIRRGVVDIIDLVNALNVDQNLVLLNLTGREIAQILDDNVPDPFKDRPYMMDGPEADRLAQVSGLRYAYDPSRPEGKRIIETDLVPDKIYSVVVEESALDSARKGLMLPAGKITSKETGATMFLALYGYAAHLGKVGARVEGRIRETSAPVVTSAHTSRSLR
jgi:predicted esterase